MKARVSSKRKRGRPPLPANEREPNGRASRNKAAVAVYDIMNKRIAMEARMRVYGASAAQCEDVKWGYLLGRLYLTTGYGMKSHQHEAGVRMAQDYARYFGLCGFPMPNARALDLFRVSGRSGDADPEAAQRAHDRVTEIRARLPGNIRTIVEAVCIYEHEHGTWSGMNLTLLKAGLNNLAAMYQIPQE